MSRPAKTTLRAFQLGVGDGQRFCLLHFPADGAPAGALVHVHPFAEEMNKSRRMAALQARAFAAAGYAVLQIDLAGCGDSSGDFAAATWAGWIEDVRAAMRWLAAETGQTPWLWGHRAGCLLCVDAVAEDEQAAPRFLFWQPPVAGKTLLQQFRRLRAAGEALRATAPHAGGDAAADARAQAAGSAAEAMSGAAAALAVRTPQGALSAAASANEPEEVAGYLLGRGLTQGMERSRLRTPLAASRSVWLEVSTRAPATLLPATQRAADEWMAAGHQVFTEVVEGPAFWQTQEIETAPALVSASLGAVLRVDGVRSAAA